MTLPVENSRIIFQGDGSTTTFHFPDTFWADSELEVVLVDSDGSESVLDPIFYELVHPTWPPYEGCDVEFPSTGSSAAVLTADQQLVVYRRTDLDQQTELNNQSAYFLETIEKTFDRLVRQMQEMEDSLRRSPQVPISVPIDVDVVMGLPEPGEFLRWAEDGSYSLDTYPLNDFDSQEWIDAWHREWISQVAEDKIPIERGWVFPTTANWNGITTPGYYSYLDSLNSGMTNTPPNLSPTGMLTVTSSYSNVLQVYCNSADNSKYSRIHYNGTWQAWEPIGGMIDQGILDITVTDADTVTDSGLYYVVGATTVSDSEPFLLRAMPGLGSVNGILSVEETEGQIRQHFSALVAPDAGRSFIRTYYSVTGTWSEWRETTGLTVDQLPGQLIGYNEEHAIQIDRGEIGATTNWDTLAQPGFYRYNASIDTAQTNKPTQVGTQGLLSVEVTAEQTLRQIYSANVGGVTLTSIRVGEFDGSSAWTFSPWFETGDSDLAPEWHVEYYSQVTEDHLQVEKNIIANTTQNWDNLITPGWYTFESSYDVGMTNTPPNLGIIGILEVETTTSLIKQEYTHTLEPVSVCMRTYANGIWTDWLAGTVGEFVEGETGYIPDDTPLETGFAGIAFGGTTFIAYPNHDLPDWLKISEDGDVWNAHEIYHYSDPFCFNGLAYSNGRWVASMWRSLSDRGLYYNTNFGEYSWQQCSFAALPANDAIGGVFYSFTGVAYGNGAWVVMMDDASFCYGLQRSTDGYTFTNAYTGWSYVFDDIIFANGSFLLYGRSQNIGQVWRSVNGITWSNFNQWTNFGIDSAAYGNGRWVMLASNTSGAGYVLYSDDNTGSWTVIQPDFFADGHAYTGLAYGNGRFVACTPDVCDEQIISSVDGVNWEIEDCPYDASWSKVAYANGVFAFVASSGDYGYNIMVRKQSAGGAIGINAIDVPVDTTFFNTILSSSDDNVQAALNTLDDHTHPSQTLDTSSFDGILSSADTTVQQALETIDDHTHSATDMTLPDGWTPPGGGGGEVTGEYSWYCLELPEVMTPTGAAYSPILGRTVVVGYGNYPNNIWYSDDQGATWTSAGAPGDMDVSWQDVTYGNGRFVAVCNDSPDNVLAYSDDGANWTVPDTQAGNNSYIRVEYGNTYFVAVADSTGSNNVLYSEDGETWFMASTGLTYGIVDMCFGQGYFYVICNGGDDGWFARSVMGATWAGETQVGSPGTFTGIAASDSAIVAVMESSTSQAFYSVDGGENWQVIDTSGLSSTQQWWQDITYGDGMFMAVGSRTGYEQVITSENGIDWTENTSPCAGVAYYYVHYLNQEFLGFNDSGTTWTMMQYLYEEEEPSSTYELEDPPTVSVPTTGEPVASCFYGGRWVIVGRWDYPDNFFYSDDAGATWNTGSYSGQDIGWASVAYGDGQWVGVSGEGLTSCIVSSTDGITWTDVAASSSVINSWYDIAYGNGLWVVVGSTFMNECVMISTDAINWTLVDVGSAYNLNSVTYWEAGGLFVAVGSLNGYAAILTSSDGETWTNRAGTDFADCYLYGIAAGEDTLVATAAGGDRFLISFDAIDWYVAFDSVTTGYWYSVAYGDGRFVAVSNDSSAPNIAVSHDGDYWTFSQSTYEAPFNHIAYGDLDFCIIASSGSPYQVMWFRGTAADPDTPIEVTTPFHAAYIEVATDNFDNNLMADPPLDTVQACLDYIDDMDLSGSGGGSTSAVDIVLDGSNFDGNLAGVDLNVQAAMDAIDDLTVGGLVIDTTNFDDILSPAEDTVQKALDVLDDHRHPAARITLTTTDFDGILGTGQTNVQLAMDVIDDHGHDAADILPDSSGASAGDVLTWDGTQFIWQAPPSLGTITAEDIALDTTYFDGILDGTILDVQAAIDALDDHGHDATDIGTVTSNFNGFFSSTQNTVQKCLDVMDDHTHTLTAADVTVDVTDFDGVLSTADTVLQHALDTIDDHLHPIDDLLPDQSTANPGDVLVTDGSNAGWVTPEGNNFTLSTVYFDGILSGADFNVQLAMDTIDDHYHTNNVPKCGFEDRSQSTLPDSMTGSGFFLTGTYTFWVNGAEFSDKDGAVDIGSSYGYHYIWYDVDGVMQSSEIRPPIDYEHCLIATVMWNGTEGFVIDQRHLATRNADLAAMMDDTVGARYGDGFDATFTNTAFSIGAGHYWDEDLRYDIPVTTLCRIMHRDGTSWTWTDQQAEYYIADAGVLQWDNLGTLSDLTDGYFMAIWVYATGDVLNKIWMLCGQRRDATLDDARVNNDLPNLSLPGSVRDARLLYRVILQQVGTTPTYVETRDYRKANVINGNEIVTGDHLYLENIGTMTHPELEQAIADLGASVTGYMNWKGSWVPALYEVGDVVADDQWSMVAITETSERPAPQPVGDLFWVREAVGDPVWENSSTESNVLYLGQRYNFTESYRVSTIRTYHNTSALGLNVEIWAVMAPGTDDERISNLLPGRVLEESDLDTWQSFNVGNLYVAAGSVVDLIKVVRPSTGSVTFTHTWIYEGATGDPSSGRIYHQRGSSLNEMRVHAVDNGGTDRSAELDNIGPGSTITMATSGYVWEVISASNTGDIYTFIVDPGTSASNTTSDFTFLYIAPIPINYVYAADLFSSSPNVSGFFGSEYLPNEAAYLNDNGYGLDIQVQNMTSSEDWDVVAYPPSGSFTTGGGSAGGGDAIDIALDITSFDGILGPTDLNVQTALNTIDDHGHTEADITDLDKYTQAQVDAALTMKADAVHDHTESDITDLDKYTQAEVDALLLTKADDPHTHTEGDITDLDKYSQSEVDTLLDGKADAAHAHPKLMLEVPADGDWSGKAVPLTVATDGGAFALHYVNASGQLAPADADADTTVPGMFLALAAGTGVQNMLIEGLVTNSAWAWTPGGILYASNTTGGMTQTPPSGIGDQVQTVGLAITATTILFKPDLVIAEIGLFG